MPEAYMREKEKTDQETSGKSMETNLSDLLNMQERFLIRIPARRNPKLKEIIRRVNVDDELYTLWQVINNNAVKRLGMSDHGPVHVQIVVNIALKFLRLLADRGIQPTSVADYHLAIQDAEVIIALAALLHDMGISIHRTDHELYSLFLAVPKIKELLDGLYEVSMRTVLISEILHAIISHRSEGKPLTLEAGIVRVADALDMEEGRTRIPFQAGRINIHSVSAASIERIRIERGEDKPIRIVVTMSNSAGVFQLDELLKNKLEGSGLESYVDIDASIQGETEKKLIHTFHI
jgi:metal-dependent HD superfamily phosphatase/phosphodiesterase